MSVVPVTCSLRVVAFALVMVAIAVPLEAQTPAPLFTDNPRPSDDAASAAADARVFVVRSRNAAVQPLVVRRAIAGPASDAFTLNLFDDASYRVSVDSFHASGSNNLTWVGHITGRPLSSVVLTLSPDFVAGRVNDGTTLFEIVPAGTGEHRIDQLDTTLMPKTRDTVVGVPASAATGPLPAGDGQLSAPAAAPLADVLVFYSPGVRAQSGAPAQAEALAARLIAESNLAYGRSGISGRVRMLGALEVPAPDGVSGLPLLEALRTHPLVNAQRNGAGADMVLLLVTHLDDPQLCGIGYIGPASDYTFSVASTRSECYTNVAHELGHIFGAQHALGDNVLEGPQYPAYARGFKAADHSFRTIMAYDCPTAGGCPITLNFSNPGVLTSPPFPSGQATGTPAQNNARRIQEVFPAVAGYRVARIPPSAPLSLQGSVSGNSVTLSWQPPAAGGSPTDYLLVAGTASGLSNVLSGAPMGDTSLVAAGIPNGQYFVRVYARNAGGVSAPSNEIMVSVGPPCGLPAVPRNPSFVKSGFNLAVSWAPPATGNPTAYLLQAGSAPGSADLFNAMIGSTTSVSASVPPGTYFVRVFAANACGIGAPSPELTIGVP